MSHHIATSSIPAEPHRATSEPRASELRVTPAFDVVDVAGELRFLFDVPGVGDETLELRVEAGRLHLDARQALSEREARLVAPLRFAGSFALPDDADPDRVAAELAHGVLTVRVPRLARSRSVPVTVGRA